MNVNYKVIGSLKGLIPGKKPEGTIELEENSKILDLCNHLGLEKNMQMAILMNQKTAKWDTMLFDQVEVSFVPVVSGG